MVNKKPPKCPKCGFDCVEDKASIVCPNCDYVTMKEHKWRGEHIECPKCQANAKIYRSHEKGGKTFMCDVCKTIGKLIDEEHFRTKVYEKKSDVGVKLTWLFQVPCRYWYKKDLVSNKICPKCDIKEICDAHSDEIHEFCERKNIEVYFTKDYIEIVHKE